MGPKDLIVTPLLLIVIYFLVLFIRPLVSDKKTKVYFIPAISLKILGALALGFIYQYYYEGGDTFTYFEKGSRYIWEAFLDSPGKAMELIFANGEYQTSTYEYASKIIFYQDLPSYFVVRVAGLFDIITFHTYSATAVLFAVVSFSGLWAMFINFYKFYPKLHLGLAIAIFFIPSVFFWGSGLLKDSITLGAVGWATYAFSNIFFFRKKIIFSVLVLLLALFVIYEIKIYILLCLVPAFMIWVYLSYMQQVNNLVLKTMVLPFSLSILILGGYLSIKGIGAENRRYNIENITQTAEATARWLTYVSMREGGSGYTLGDFDYSPSGIIEKAPSAIWVTLFRPYLWEIKNPVMLLSAIESFALLTFTLIVFLVSGYRGKLKSIFTHPIVIFCFSFTIAFSFAVGISTYNFGSLVRYKIPMLPFYLTGLFILLYYSKRRKKVVRLAVTEK